jgi:hypothetical protein
LATAALVEVECGRPLDVQSQGEAIVHYFQAFRPFFHGLEDNWIWLMGLVLMVEPLLDYLWADYRTRADKYISRKLRTRLSWGIATASVLMAIFMAFADQWQKAETAIGQRDEARRQASPVQQSTIDRLSGDLTAARGQIDEQDKIIKQQQAKIERQDQQITALQPKPDRHLTDDDKQRLENVFTPLKTDFPTLAIDAPSDGEAQGFAKELADEFNKIGIQVGRVSIVFPMSASHSPLQVAVKDLKKVPPKAEAFAEAMVRAGFPVQGATLESLGDESNALIVGVNR